MRPGVGRGGFTLLELIVVIVLLVALAGLALPGLFARLAGSTVEAVRTRLEAAGAICRADAQRSGEVVEMSARQERGAVVIRSRAVNPARTDPAAGEVLLELPPGYAVTATPPGRATIANQDGPIETSPLGAVAGLVLAVFQPDGSGTLPGERFVVVGGTVLELHLTRWSGRMTLAEWIAKPEEVPEVEPAKADAGSDLLGSPAVQPVGKKGAER